MPPPTPDRILHIHFGKEGGAERFFVNLARAFDARGVEQRFLIRPGRTWHDDLAVLGTVRQAHYPRVWPMRSVLRAWVERQVRTWRPDAVMAWIPKAATLLPRNEGPARFVRLGNYPRHTRHFEDADCVIAITPDLDDHMRSIGWNGPTRMIANFARPAPTHPDPVPFELPEGAFRICAAGRFVKIKGFDTLIRAVAQVPGAALCLIGDGAERPALEALVAELGITDRVQFTGWVPEPMAWITQADAACVSSTHEPLGNSSLEAWSSNVPLIASPAEGPSWLIEDGQTGVLAADFSVDALAHAIRRVKDDPDLRARLVENGTARLATVFSVDAIVDAYFEAIPEFRTWPMA